MKKSIFTFVCAVLMISANATPGKGGYLGHRLIFGVEGSYAPFYTSLKDFATHWDLQYGANFNIITGRRTQVGFSYDRYSLSGNERYAQDLFPADRLRGNKVGVNVRMFRAKRGGLAPIGKFFDMGLDYSMNTFDAGSDSVNTVFHPGNSNLIHIHVAAGTQMVFKDHLVLNTGLRMGKPIYEISGVDSRFIKERLLYKDIFSVYFGIGILL